MNDKIVERYIEKTMYAYDKGCSFDKERLEFEVNLRKAASLIAITKTLNLLCAKIETLKHIIDKKSIDAGENIY